MTQPRSNQARRLRLGAACTVAAAGLSLLILRDHAWIGAATFGAVATGLQLLAAQVMAQTGVPAALDHLKVYALGVVLRLGGVALLGLAVAVDRTLFAPLPCAAGYLGTVLPLLYLETRLTP